jgi:sulfate transport system ATP-binding protein
MSIHVQNIRKTFGNFTALDNISLTVPDGKLVALLGPSGSGKTTLLRIIAGLEQPDQGHILMDGQDATLAPVRDRRVGFVFQHYALFRHMSVFENVAFGLRVKRRHERPSKQQIHDKVMELLSLVQIDFKAHSLPGQLSGGQRQRVALARALAVEPKVLLLDEPFGALDAKVRKELRRWLRRLHDEIHVTSVFVTHDVDEALEVADEVVVMNHARIEQIGTPDDVYQNPANAFVYQFLGGENVLPRKVQGETKPAHVRPHDLRIVAQRYDEESLEAVIERIHSIGPIVRVELRLKNEDRLVESELAREEYERARWIAGQNVFVHPRKSTVYEDETHHPPLESGHI